MARNRWNILNTGRLRLLRREGWLSIEIVWRLNGWIQRLFTDGLFSYIVTHEDRTDSDPLSLLGLPWLIRICHETDLLGCSLLTRAIPTIRCLDFDRLSVWGAHVERDLDDVLIVIVNVHRRDLLLLYHWLIIVQLPLRGTQVKFLSLLKLIDYSLLSSELLLLFLLLGGNCCDCAHIL